MSVETLTRSEAPIPHPPGALRLTLIAAPFAAVGVVDACLTAVRARDDTGLWLAASLLSVLGLWLLAGLVLAKLGLLLLRAVLGPQAFTALGPRAHRALLEVYRESDATTDQRRAATLIACLAAGAFAVAGSLVLLVYLISHRNGAALIATTFLVGQLALAALSILPGVALYRLCMARPFAFLRVRIVTAVVIASSLIVTLAVVVLARSVLEELDAASLALLAVALAAGPFVVAWAPNALTRRGLPAVAAIVGGLLVLVPLQAAPVREVVSKRSFTAKLYLNVLQRLSDVDRDGSPALPHLTDCAPFNASIHPLAREVPGNGIDENCDDLDLQPQGAGNATARFGPLKREGPKPNLVLITIDSLRADHVGAYGYKGQPTTPTLDELAKESTLFTLAFAQDSGTVPSMWSLMVGKTPFQTRLETKNRFPPNYAEGELKLAEALRAGGYRTSSVLCGSYFARPYWNLKDGFDEWREVCGKRMELSAPVVTEAALDALDDIDDDEPYFLWVHYFDPHKPYTDHDDIAWGTHTKARYDEEIAYADRHLAPLLQKLKSSSRPTYIAITADHGENFGEHGKAPHARTLYREVTHVPLILHGPDVKARRVKAPVAVGDLFPTLIDLAGLPVPAGTTMVSQAHVLLGAAPDDERIVFQENSWSRPLRHMKGAVTRRHHMLLDLTNNTVELYDLRADKREKKNLYGKGVEGEQDLERALRDFAATTELPVWMR